MILLFKKKFNIPPTLIRLILVAASCLLILYTLCVYTISNLNIGVFMPAIIGFPLLIIGIFYKACIKYSQKGIGKIIKIIVISGYSLFSISFLIIVLIIIININTQPKPGADAFIVLGAGLRGDIITQPLAARLDKAIEYLTSNNNTVVVVSGGQGPDESITEAYAMKEYLISNGIDSNRIIEEDKSTSTYENFKFSKEILDKKFLNKNYRVVFATNDFHVFRAKMIAHDAGLNADATGAKSRYYMIPNFYLREYLAIFKYLILSN